VILAVAPRFVHKSVHNISRRGAGIVDATASVAEFVPIGAWTPAA
jgi:hypothetical protein